jgi:hypothetical protein
MRTDRIMRFRDYQPRRYEDRFTDYYPDRRIGFSYDTRRNDYERGYAQSYSRMNQELADEWMRNLENEDGSKGAHWSFEQTANILEQKKLDCDAIEFYVAMNMLYSDYYKVAKKFNVNNTEFYAELAEAFLCDKDAAEDKLLRYFECIIE